MTGPKEEDDDTKGRRYHAKENMRVPPPFSWEYTSEVTGTVRTNALLVRILIAKVNDQAVLESILATIPIRAEDPAYPGWNCVAWLKEALETIASHPQRSKALGTAILDWQTVRNAAMDYVGKKREQSRWGVDAHKTYDMQKAPTFDLLQEKETIA